MVSCALSGNSCIDAILFLWGTYMPGHMIHIIVAKKVYPDAGIDFFVGNLAPDANAPYSNSELANAQVA